MSRASFLMCAPIGAPGQCRNLSKMDFWGAHRTDLDGQKAVEQWKGLHSLLKGSLNSRVELMEPVEGLPYMVFAGSSGIVRKRLFIRSNFRHPARRGEEPHYEKWFKKQGFQVRTIERPFCLEGQADGIFWNQELYLGFHSRSDAETFETVAGYLKIDYFGLELCDKRFYHLSDCFAPLTEKSALVYLPALEPYSRMTLRESIPDPISVSEEEALGYACHALVIERDVILPSGCSRTRHQLETRGFKVHVLDFSEFVKIGGAVRSLVLRIA